MYSRKRLWRSTYPAAQLSVTWLPASPWHVEMIKTTTSLSTLSSSADMEVLAVASFNLHPQDCLNAKSVSRQAIVPLISPCQSALSVRRSCQATYKIQARRRSRVLNKVYSTAKFAKVEVLSIPSARWTLTSAKLHGDGGFVSMMKAELGAILTSLWHLLVFLYCVPVTSWYHEVNENVLCVQ